MLKNLKKIRHFKIITEDEEYFGKVSDIYFDEEQWVLRYLVVKAKNWASQSFVLISPYNVIDVDWSEGFIWVNLTRNQIEKCPKAWVNAPVNRLQEYEYNNHFGLPHYWLSGLGLEVDGVWAGRNYPHLPESLEVYNSPANNEFEKDECLRSMEEVLGFAIEGVEGIEFGAVTDLILEEATWVIRYLVFSTHKILPGGKKILFSPDWIKEFDWNSKKLKTDLHRKVIENCPEYNPDLPIESFIEDNLFSHFSHLSDWTLSAWRSRGIDYHKHPR